MKAVLGQILDGRYRVLRQLGEGGMGVVYLVEHVHLGRKEALKVLHASLASDSQLVARFRREARAINRLQHPNIVSVHDFGQLPGDRFYLAMEYVEGDDLATVLAREQRLPPQRVLHLMRQLAEAVAHAHSRGVVHRDLKPENLLLRERRGRTDHLMVLDFGIAKIVAPDYKESIAATPVGEIFGTIAYMAPEQLTGDSVDGRSDIYAMGCLLFELLTGEAPFRGRNIEVMHQHLNAPPPIASQLVPGVSPELDALIVRCMAKDPDQRFADGEELARALERLPVPVQPERQDFEVGQTQERDFARAPATAPTAELHPEELKEASWRALRELVERLVDAGNNDLQLVLGVARAEQLDGERDELEREVQTTEERIAQVEQSSREREASLRFALGELHFQLAQVGDSPELQQQIDAFREKLLALAADTQRRLDTLMDRAIGLAAARADLDEKRARLYGPLGVVAAEILARGDEDELVAVAAERWRSLRSLAGGDR
jgi:hypothetical protein